MFFFDALLPGFVALTCEEKYTLRKFEGSLIRSRHIPKNLMDVQ